MLHHVAVQTDHNFDQYPVRIESEPGSGIYKNIKPDYLEGLAFIMSEGASASQELKHAYIWDTIVWKQVRHLPLRLDQHYMNSFKLLKKLNHHSSVNKSTSDSNTDDTAFSNEEEFIVDEECSDTNFDDSTKLKIDELRKVVEEEKSKRKSRFWKYITRHKMCSRGP